MCISTNDCSIHFFQLSFLWKEKQSMKRKEKLGWQDVSAPKGTCHHSWQLEFNLQNTHDEKRKPTFASSLLIPTHMPLCTHAAC